jgi:hypothetical protein
MTNEQRMREKIIQRRERTFTQTPLMDLGTWMFNSSTWLGIGKRKETIRGAPWQLLEAAYRHVEVRLVSMAATGIPSARLRSTERWLGRWLQIIEGEMHRQTSGNIGPCNSLGSENTACR